jgi:hypothetical protein
MAGGLLRIVVAVRTGDHELGTPRRRHFSRGFIGITAGGKFGYGTGM